MRKLWTTEENDLIKLMKGQGMTYQQMVPLLPDRNLRTISVQGAKLCPPSKSPKAWSKEEEEQLIQLRAEGVPYKEISEIMGRSYSAVKTKGSYIITSKHPRTSPKTPMAEQESRALSDLNDLELEYIETGQEYFKF